MITARVQIFLKDGVLDPQGKSIAGALENLGFNNVRNVRQGKLIILDLETGDKKSARESLELMCKKLLANTVIENYAIEIE